MFLSLPINVLLSKRLYLANTAFTLALNPEVELPALPEQFFVNDLAGRFFLRTPQKEEIDLIIADDYRLLPVEVKIREKIGREDRKILHKFMEKNNLTKALLITMDTEGRDEKEQRVVEAIPYWRYWSIKRALRP